MNSFFNSNNYNRLFFVFLLSIIIGVVFLFLEFLIENSSSILLFGAIGMVLLVFFKSKFKP
ncbi:MAG: hypothetical protein CM15mP121_1820 [Bacteroidota bacterium]|nr:MAG: hypothetical protein CM15mP121_1820 [Bacteroidota bacterium]